MKNHGFGVGPDLPVSVLAVASAKVLACFNPGLSSVKLLGTVAASGWLRHERPAIHKSSVPGGHSPPAAFALDTHLLVMSETASCLPSVLHFILESSLPPSQHVACAPPFLQIPVLPAQQPSLLITCLHPLPDLLLF